MDDAVKELAGVVRAALASWPRTLRLCVILAVAAGIAFTLVR